MQRLPAALEQAIVGGVLDQRVLEAIVGSRRRALDKQEVGFGEPLQRRLQRRLVQFGDVTQQRVGEVASKNSPDLRHLARRAKPIEARGERLLQGRRDRLNAALLTALEKQARHLLDEQRHAAGALADPLDHFLGERMAGRDLADHARDAGAIERGQRNQAMVRAQAPRRPELRTSRSQEEQRRLRATVGERAQQVERRRVSPVQVLESEHDRLRPRPSQNQSGHCRQLPAPQLLRWEASRALRRQRNVYERREQGRVFRRVEANQPQRVLEICRGAARQEHPHQSAADPIRRLDAAACSAKAAKRSTRSRYEASQSAANGTLE